MKNLFKRLRSAFGENYFISSLVIFFLCVSSAYQFIQYSHHLDNAKRDLNSIHQEYQHIRWETIKSVIGVINREGKLHSSLVAHILCKRIDNEYNNLNDLKATFDSGKYTDGKFNYLILNTVSSNSFMKDASDRNGILVSVDDRILYNLIITHDRFDMSWKEFIEKNYNQKLAKNTLDSIISNTSGTRILEPRKNTLNGHQLIDKSSLEELEKIYLKEGLAGLYGYLIITPYYITKDGDIFNTPDFDINGIKNKNHKIIVMSYISIYDVIKEYHEKRLNNIDKLEINAIKKQEENIANIYYSSIESLLFHFACIGLVILIVKFGLRKND